MTLYNHIRLVVMAVIARILDIVRPVAGFALQLQVLVFHAMVQREIMLPDACWAPCVCRVAVITLQTEHTGVDFRFLMALITLRRCPSINVIYMAGNTVCGCMFAIQREEICMIEIAQPVHAIVASHALQSELLLVVRHELLVMLSMAFNTGLYIQRLQIIWMTC